MKHELQKASTDALVRWADGDGGKAIPRELAKKDKLTFRNWLWVHNAAFGLTGSLITCIASCYFVWEVGMTTVPYALCFTACVISALAAIVFTCVLFNRDDHESSAPSTNERTLIEKHERSRQAVPWLSQRNGRAREMDYAYNQYSVWVYPQDSSVMLCILQHTPWKDGKYKTSVFEWTPDSARDFLDPDELDRFFQYQSKKGRDFYEYRSVADVEIKTPSPETVAQMRGALEKLAEGLEQRAYQNGRKKIDARRMALIFRRS